MQDEKPDSHSDWFEAAWEYREERLYRSWFGDMGPGIFTIPIDYFANLFRHPCDPRWLHTGVFECPPGPSRAHWSYVTSGLSNEWWADTPDPEKMSGIGCEFLLECKEQSPWAIKFLLKMAAFQILLAHERFPGKGELALGDRVPLRGPIDGEQSALTWALLMPCSRFPGLQQIPSGKFELMQFVGITEGEAAFGRERGSDALIPVLLAARAAPIVDPKRTESPLPL